MTSPDSTSPQVGSVLSGKYRIDRIIGAGAMGVVFEATHLRIGQRVAIKMLQAKSLASPEVVVRFEREARAAGQLRSPHVARTVDVDETPDGLPYLVMEYLEGHDLAKELEARRRLPIGEAVDYVRQAAAAMTEAHARGIVHRDLKPANLFLAREGAAIVLKVLDFGISKIIEANDADARLTSTLATMGTPLYMSPEQVRAARTVDARSDVWSLGVILFEALAGIPPFGGANLMSLSAAVTSDPPPSLRALRSEVPEGLVAIVLKALAKSPEDRWASMDAFSTALAPFGDVAPTSIARLDPGRRTPTPAPPSTLAGAATADEAPFATGSRSPSSRVRLVLVGLAVLLVVAAGVFAAVHTRGKGAVPQAASGPTASDELPAPVAASASSAALPGADVAPSPPSASPAMPAPAASYAPSASSLHRPAPPAATKHLPESPAAARPPAAPPARGSPPSPTANPIHL